MRWIGTWGLGLLLALSGCATSIKGTNARVTFDSKPAGATVAIDGKPYGITPFSIRLDHGPDYEVEFTLAGHHPYRYRLTSSFSGHSLWFPPYSMLIDIISGAMFTLDEDRVFAALVPLPGGAPAPEASAPQVAQAPAPQAPAPQPEAPVPAGPELKVVVLEFANNAQLTPFELESLSDLVRVAALSLPGSRLFVYTRENLLELLPPDTDLSKCEGACEVETGRNVGADLVITGAVGHFGGRLQVKLSLHTTRTGRLVGAEVVSAADIAGLEPVLTEAGKRLARRALLRAAAEQDKPQG
ncbi:MAG: PEGA domain-containing protein [Myxococcales bacterium]|nr:PEGA domain-containing protein [Myxococcales bacterium]